MANKYEWGINPIKDFFIQNLIDDVDISKKEYFETVYKELMDFIELLIPDKEDIKYLDFDIKKDKFGNYKIIANNIIVALWFQGIIPVESNEIIINNKLIFNGFEYTFIPNKKHLKINKI